MKENFKIGKYKNPLHYEADMQILAKQNYGDLVPEVYGKTQGGFIQEFAGRQLGSKDFAEGLKFLEETTEAMFALQGGDRVMHLDLYLGQVMKSKTGQMKLVDWGFAVKVSKSQVQEIRTMGLSFWDDSRNYQKMKKNIKTPEELAKQSARANQSGAQIFGGDSGVFIVGGDTNKGGTQILNYTKGDTEILSSPVDVDKLFQTQWDHKLAFRATHKQAITSATKNMKNPGSRHTKRTGTIIL